jgi:acetyl-CoA carboxylase biotin carboxyl carrier protein
MDEALEENLKALIGLMEEHGLEELRLEGPELKIKLSKTLPETEARPSPYPTSAKRGRRSEPSHAHGGIALPGREHLHELRSPLTGIFYRASSPSSPPLVQPGEYVKTGQVVCLIEAMKMYNEIHCDRAGRLVDICAGNGDIVETDQLLMLIDIHAEQPEE